MADDGELLDYFMADGAMLRAFMLQIAVEFAKGQPECIIPRAPG